MRVCQVLLLVACCWSGIVWHCERPQAAFSSACRSGWLDRTRSGGRSSSASRSRSVGASGTGSQSAPTSISTCGSRCSRRCSRSSSARLLGLGVGLWLALSPMASALLDPYIKALNSMPRVILAPIFAVWFGLGVASQGRARRDAGVLHRVLQRLPGREGSEPGRARQRAHARRDSRASCCARSTCRRRRAGCFPACTPRSAWLSSARWSANTWARRAAWAI